MTCINPDALIPFAIVAWSLGIVFGVALDLGTSIRERWKRWRSRRELRYVPGVKFGPPKRFERPPRPSGAWMRDQK